MTKFRILYKEKPGVVRTGFTFDNEVYCVYTGDKHGYPFGAVNHYPSYNSMMVALEAEHGEVVYQDIPCN